MSAAPALTLEREGALATLTLTRPELLNRFDRPLHAQFTEALALLDDDRDVRAVVLASTGRVFSAGGDFELMRSAHEDPAVRRSLIDDAQRLLTALIGLRQPIVAAMHGAAIGLGATVVLSCDAVIAAREAMLADSHVNVGLVAGDGGCLVWPAAAGMLRARRHLLTGDPLEAETAFQLGLVTDLVETPDDVLPAARALAERIAALPPLAVQLTKRALTRSLLQRAGEVIDLSLAYEETTLASDDLLEGITALKERRPGVFAGR
jgi:enoyl-CoA hydratase